MIELLAPAGNMECLKAAILNGADAVYLGLDEFNARKRADNFTRNNFLEAVDFCHVRSKKVYLTLNTLINSDEMDKAMDAALFAYNHGVDAVIVQDLGLAYNIKKHIPDLRLHASTQCTAINEKGVRNLTKLGFDRVVIGREVSIKQLSDIGKLDAEVEVFVHGALCVSYSGQCLMSSLNGGRSGNRGLCAQPCRLQYEVMENGKVIEDCFILSPKDVCTIEKIDEIIKSGVTSLKIEGRMKSPVYVAQVVSSYRNAINGRYKKEEYSKLLQVFNRNGFFSSYLFEKPGKNIFAYTSSKNSGLKIGTVLTSNRNKDLIVIKTDFDIESGDGISFDSGNTGMYVRLIGKKGNLVSIIAGGIFPEENSEVYLTFDKSLDKELQVSFQDEFKVKTTLEVNAYFKVGDYPSLVCKDMTVTGNQKCEVANNSMKERIISQLLKCGNTVFEMNITNDEIDENAYYPIAKINEMRRNLLDQVYESMKVTVKTHQIKEMHIPDREKQFEKKISVFFYKKRNDIDLSKLDADIIYLPYEAKTSKEDQKVVYWMEENNISHPDTLVSNIGLIDEQNYLDYGLNITNPWTILAYEKLGNILMITSSVESSESNMEYILGYSQYPIEQIVYGKLAAMKSKYCINGSLFDKNECSGKALTIKNKEGKNYDILTYCKTCTSYILDNDISNHIGTHDQADTYRINIHQETLEEIVTMIAQLKEDIKNKSFIE
ncbi:MAG: U32 family peptidase [Clostridia bacterium]|nr:U32 family peptidase [Clostridia bacterium]